MSSSGKDWKSACLELERLNQLVDFEQYSDTVEYCDLNLNFKVTPAHCYVKFYGCKIAMKIQITNVTLKSSQDKINLIRDM